MARPTPYLVLATPGMNGMADYRYMQSLFRLIFYCNSHGIPVALEMITHDPILARARGTLAAKFLDRPGASHILFIGPGRRFSVRLVLAMLAQNKDIIVAPDPVPAAPLSCVLDTEVHAPASTGGEDLDVLKPAPAQPCHEVENTALDFALIRREALLRLLAACPERRLSGALGDSSGYHSPFLSTLFEPEIDPDCREYLSGETAFCRRWHKTGGKIYCLGAAPPPCL